MPKAIALQPTTLTCLRCQLTGARSLLCARRDTCREAPQVHLVGPALLAAWITTVVAFLLATR